MIIITIHIKTILMKKGDKQMNSKNTKLIKTDSIFFKIKKFFRNLFNKNLKKQNQIDDQKNKEIEHELKENSIETISEQNRLLNIQTQFKKNQICEKDISEEDIKKLSNLYDEQIKMLKEKIKNNNLNTEKYKLQIIDLKKQIN